ncbi:unnamed protein product [Rhizoctonia solani]|uniref:TATA box binding protein associated factor (TAF) histone-like fold domain-containing protein n=1 Tax=Rhizoctonia solani TaxID=456999 RepID=A0A8H3HZI9_9AGAM|nr:unnamed protein product [Rhizoctonia solani]
MAEASTSKGKSRPIRAPVVGGIYRADSVKDVADSLGITNLPDTVAAALASDLEYRLHQVIEIQGSCPFHSAR